MHNNEYAKIKESIEQAYPGTLVLLDEPMAKHTTFRIGGPSDLYIEPSVEALPGVVSLLQYGGIPITITGNGSNLLVSDAGINGAVVSLGQAAADITVSGNTVTAQAGTVIFFPADRALHTEILLHSRGVAGSGFPPLSNIPHCCLP